MTQIDPKILGKIKKCLALSASSNPNEAATALRQARALMEKYGVSSHEVAMSEVGESRAASHTLSREKPAAWEVLIASLVGRAFGCQLMFERSFKRMRSGSVKTHGAYIFVGLSHHAEVASYTATVLIRRCKRARQKWISENFGGLSVGTVGVKKKITQMGDAFATGWASEINKLVSDFAVSMDVQQAIARHIHENTGGKEGKTRESRPDNDRYFSMALTAGAMAAKDERLYRPVETAQGEQLAIEN